MADNLCSLYEDKENLEVSPFIKQIKITMETTHYILGIITGLILAVITVLSVRKYQTKIERTVKQIENKFKEKGDIFIVEDSQKELENFLDNLPKE